MLRQPEQQYGGTDAVSLKSFSGTFTSESNAYNGSNQYNYAPSTTRNCSSPLFTTTNGGNNPSASNPLSKNYAQLQQLQTDLNSNTVAQYNWITPDQYNDVHSARTGGFTNHRYALHWRPGQYRRPGGQLPLHRRSRN